MNFRIVEGGGADAPSGTVLEVTSQFVKLGMARKMVREKTGRCLGRGAFLAALLPYFELLPNQPKASNRPVTGRSGNVFRLNFFLEEGNRKLPSVFCRTFKKSPLVNFPLQLRSTQHPIPVLALFLSRPLPRAKGSVTEEGQNWTTQHPSCPNSLSHRSRSRSFHKNTKKRFLKYR